MIYSIGSINIDHVYRVPRLPAAGETLTATSYQRFLGGKGVNQSIAIVRSGGDVTHVGAIGPDGGGALQDMEAFGVTSNAILKTEEATGHAIIYVEETSAENNIVIHGGANQALTLSHIERALSVSKPGDWAVFQNETNLVAEAMELARRKGLKICYSAAPFDASAALPLLEKIDLLAVNESEAEALASYFGDQLQDIPVNTMVITKGSNGVEFHQRGQDPINRSAFKVDAVDTTGAGDTFIGAFLARLSLGEAADDVLKYASAAAALQVTKQGAATAIPVETDVFAFMTKEG